MTMRDDLPGIASEEAKSKVLLLGNAHRLSRRILAILRLRGASGSGCFSSFLASAGTNWAKVSRTPAWALTSVGGAAGAAAIWVPAAWGTIVGRLVSMTPPFPAVSGRNGSALRSCRLRRRHCQPRRPLAGVRTHRARTTAQAVLRRQTGNNALRALTSLPRDAYAVRSPNRRYRRLVPGPPARFNGGGHFFGSWVGSRLAAIGYLYTS